jgi:hypothetical protein
MSATIQSLVHRCQRQMNNFLPANEAPVIVYGKDEQVLGFYQNRGEDGIAFTSEGLRLNSQGLIRYRDITAIRVLGDKDKADHLELTLSSGAVEVVEFNGGSDRLRDIWEMLRLLDRIRAVVSATQSQLEPADGGR